MPNDARPASLRWWWLLVLLPLLGWWTYGLFDLDEGFYAAVTGEMNRRGEWITPYYNGLPWFEKPILLYWLAKPSVALFGPAIGPRLPSVVALLALAWVVYQSVSVLISPLAGRASALAVGTTLVLVALGRMMMTDAVLILCLSASFLYYFRSLDGSALAIRHRLVSAAWLGLSILAKGPVGAILFVLAIVSYAISRPDMRTAIRGRAGEWLVAVTVVLAVVATWYVPSLLANREMFVQKFLIEQNLNRFAGGDKAHAVPFLSGLFLYPLVLLLGTFPWNLSAIQTFRQRTSNPFVHYCWVWGGTVFWFFTISGSKLPHYIAPVAVPVAMVAGIHLAETRSWQHIWRNAAVASGVVFLVANLGFYGYYHAWFGGPSHAEIHAAIQAVPRGARVVTFQITRRNKDLGTGQLKVQETSHPSLAFYADQPVIDVESAADLAALPDGTYVLTRPDRDLGLARIRWISVPAVHAFRLGILEPRN